MRPGPDKHSLGQLSGLSTRISALHYNRHLCWTNKVGRAYSINIYIHTTYIYIYSNGILKSFALKQSK